MPGQASFVKKIYSEREQSEQDAEEKYRKANYDRQHASRVIILIQWVLLIDDDDSSHDWRIEQKAYNRAPDEIL